MAAYKVYFRASVEKDFAIIPKGDLKRILQRIRMLAEDPQAGGLRKTDRAGKV